MILVLYNIILITNFKLIEMCIKSSSFWRGVGGEAFFPLPHYFPSVSDRWFGEGRGGAFTSHTLDSAPT